MQKILIIDENPEEVSLLKEILKEEYKINEADTPDAGVKEAKSGEYSLILLEESIAERNDFELLKELQEKAIPRDFPVLLITDSEGMQREERALMLGVVDYVMRPFRPMFVRSRIHTHTELYQYRRSEERESAMTDKLTGVASRRRYELHNIVKWREAVRLQVPISICRFGIDELRVYNDTYGYPAGDQAIAKVAKLIEPGLKRSTDFFARYEGDEFIAIILGGKAEEVSGHLKRVCQAVENLHIPNKTSVSDWLTISIGGVTVVPKPGDKYDSYTRTAEMMLRSAKQSGKNQVVWSE